MFKLLVLIDGRTVHAPATAGVFWNVQDARGATFKVYLPQVEQQTKIPPRRLDTPDLPRGTETILRVEQRRGASAETVHAGRAGALGTGSAGSTECFETGRGAENIRIHEHIR
jgi:hypothetical protein